MKQRDGLLVVGIEFFEQLMVGVLGLKFQLLKDPMAICRQYILLTIAMVGLLETIILITNTDHCCFQPMMVEEPGRINQI